MARPPRGARLFFRAFMGLLRTRGDAAGAAWELVDVENDVPDDPTALDEVVRFGNRLERHAPPDGVAQSAAAEQMAELREARLTVEGRNLVNQEQPQRDRVLHHPQTGQHGFAG